MSYLEDGDKTIWHTCVLNRAFPRVQWREKSKCMAKHHKCWGNHLQPSCCSERGCGAFQLLGLLSSATCASAGTECSQGPSGWLHRSFLHGFQRFESRFFDSLWYWVSTTHYFPSMALLSFLDYLNVAKTYLWSNLEFRLTALAGAEWTRVHLVLHIPECSRLCWWPELGFSEPEEPGWSGAMGLDLGQESTQWAAENVTPAAISSEAVVLCLPHPYSNGDSWCYSKDQGRSSFCLCLFMIISSPCASTLLSP